MLAGSHGSLETSLSECLLHSLHPDKTVIHSLLDNHFSDLRKKVKTTAPGQTMLNHRFRVTSEVP